LNESLGGKLTLISAPAGFGKTTLVSEWLSHFRLTILDFGLDAPVSYSIENPKSKIQNRAVAWLSLDEGDSDPNRFLVYLVAALQTIAPTIGEAVLASLETSQSLREAAEREALLTALLNEITAFPHNLVLVLDDYHMIDAAPPGRPPLGAVDQTLTFLVEHLPPQMHLVITTREDPPLPLARLRARGQLSELRAADLRFTPAEAAEFLNQVMGLDLSAEEVTALERRTEGWIAGLQLAALSMRGRADVAGFVQAFTGNNRYIVDYLVEEVLQRQPARVRSFLLQTAILHRLNGSLCDAITGQHDGGILLETLERGNLFVVPLDETRHWYRYHHLFAEVLQAHLRAEQSDQIATLHRRASEWYEQHGAAADAIRHALAAADLARAADLVELAVPAMRRSRQELTLLGWLKALPDELVRTRPVLSVHYAGVLLQSGELEGVETRLRDAECWLDTTTATSEQVRPSAMVVVDREEFRRLPGWIAIYRAGQALVRGDVSETVSHARQALDLVLADDSLGRGAAAALLGLVYWRKGELEAAYQTYAEGMASVQQAGYVSDAIGGIIALADIQIAQGHLRQAMHIYEQGLQMALAQHRESSQPVLRGTADMYVGMSILYREHNDLQAARQHLLRSQELGEHIGFPQNPYRWRVAMARIKAAEGELDSALTLLNEAERLYVSDFFPNVRPVAALRTRVWLAQGRVDEALNWAREQSLSVHDELSYLREFEHITLVRVLLAHHQRDRGGHILPAAIGLLVRLLQAAEAGDEGSPRMGSAIEILVLQALAHQMQGDDAAALSSLGRALTLAEPEEYVRIFVDEGEAMRSLILEFRFWHPEGTRQQPPAEQNRKLSVYVNKVLAAFNNEPSPADEPVSMGGLQIQNPNSKIQNLIEPLSERELDVLRLFKTELSGPEIAQELVVALSTVRTHTKSIYSKLNVNNRWAAVKRATELGLI
jgi:LuxR family maltose regulon positive regulatory protein